MKSVLIIFTLLLTNINANELEHMQKACDNNIPSACYEFGILYEKGLGVKQDLAKAKAYYLKACDYGFEQACKSFEIISVEH